MRKKVIKKMPIKIEEERNGDIKESIDILIKELCERLSEESNRVQPEMITALASLVEARAKLG